MESCQFWQNLFSCLPMSQMKRTMTNTHVLGNLRYRARCGSCSAASNVSRSFSREAEVWHSTLWFFSQNKSRGNCSLLRLERWKSDIQHCGFPAKINLGEIFLHSRGSFTFNAAVFVQNFLSWSLALNIAAGPPAFKSLSSSWRVKSLQMQVALNLTKIS